MASYTWGLAPAGERCCTARMWAPFLPLIASVALVAYPWLLWSTILLSAQLVSSYGLCPYGHPAPTGPSCSYRYINCGSFSPSFFPIFPQFFPPCLCSWFDCNHYLPPLAGYITLFFTISSHWFTFWHGPSIYLLGNCTITIPL